MIGWSEALTDCRLVCSFWLVRSCHCFLNYNFFSVCFCLFAFSPCHFPFLFLMAYFAPQRSLFSEKYPTHPAPPKTMSRWTFLFPLHILLARTHKQTHTHTHYHVPPHIPPHIPPSIPPPIPPPIPIGGCCIAMDGSIWDIPTP